MACYSGPEIVNDGLVLHLDAANSRSYPGSGTTWYDLSGLGNNGTLVNGVGYSTDNIGAMVFDGVDDSSDFGNILQLGIESKTYCCWYKKILPTTTTPRYLITKTDNSTTQYRQAFGFHSDGSIYTIFRGANNVSYDFNIVNPSNDTNWHQVVWVIDRTSSILVHFDTVIIGNKDISSLDGQNFNINRPLRIGSYNTSTNTPTGVFPGYISNVQIYNRAISAAEIQQNFEATRSRYGV